MRSDAQKKADQKYRASPKNNYTSISAGMTKDQAEKCKQYAKQNGLTPSRFAVKAMLYCIENNIKFNDKEI